MDVDKGAVVVVVGRMYNKDGIVCAPCARRSAPREQRIGRRERRRWWWRGDAIG
jgi:hypothetical protein